jgi:hypothetical protein
MFHYKMAIIHLKHSQIIFYFFFVALMDQNFPVFFTPCMTFYSQCPAVLTTTSDDDNMDDDDDDLAFQQL